MKVRKNVRIVGLERAQLSAEVVRRYAAGESVRGIAESIGRSYGFVHRLLEEKQVTLRPRGGNRRSACATSAATD
ncbi:helix-turn-helix domain-containing protein [Nonomuraea basaltis]|uniref:helix-turn-helix domain-containing protein n=1 Tax=Nonomuraea basaltis TaxID=2495887 RepID=UPI00110C543F|nr:helix-turn-helix domain-containing protein [Nonomuraea basaltis]TMR91339.1 transcriptional regulator [Nonomuraea basaltis]